MRARSLSIFAALGLGAMLGGCNPAGYQDSNAGYVPAYAVNRPVYAESPFDDPGADYARRSVTISPGAGNAQAAAVALQTATTWPRYSSNTNIPGNGARMVGAVHNFESGAYEPGSPPFGPALPPPVNGTSTVFGSSGGGAGGGGY